MTNTFIIPHFNSLVGTPGFEPGVARTRIVHVTVTPRPVYINLAYFGKKEKR